MKTETITKILVGDHYGCDFIPVTVSKERWNDAYENVNYFQHKLNQAISDVEKYKSFLKTAEYQEELQSLSIYPNKLESVSKKYDKTIKVESID